MRGVMPWSTSTQLPGHSLLACLYVYQCEQHQCKAGCQTWRLPETVRLGVQYHHDPFECPDPIAHGVFLADTIAHHVAVRTGGTWSHSTPDDDVVAASAEAIAFDLSRLDGVVDATIARFSSRDTGLSLS